MGTMGCPETSIIGYQSTLHNTPEERRSHMCWLFVILVKIIVKKAVGFLMGMNEITFARVS
jgi:hypothetical protein